MPNKNAVAYHNVPGISLVKEAISIPLSKITINPETNVTRAEAKIDDKHVNDLVAHISENGIDEDLPRPIVEQDGVDHYIVRDGHHRAEALGLMDEKEIVCDVFSFADKHALHAFQAKANMHPPQKMGNQVGLVNALGGEIKSGRLLNTQTDVEARVREIAKGKNHKWKQGVIAKIIDNNGTHESWINYSDKRAKDVLNPLGYTTGFHFNPKTGRYGAVVTAGSEWRVACRAIHAYNASSHNGPGIQTDLIIKVDRKGNDDVMKKRQAVITTMNAILDGILEATDSTWKHGHLPVRYVGALPQDAGSIMEESIKKGIIKCDPDDPKFT